MADTLFELKSAEQLRESITMEQQKEIRNMYLKLHKEIQQKIRNIGEDRMRKQDLIFLRKMIEDRVKGINKDIEDNVITNMTIVVEEVVEDTRTYLLKCGFKLEEVKDAFTYVPHFVVMSIRTGNIYQDDWSLSGAIWGYNKKIQDTLNKIISVDTLQNKTAFEVAKDIEKFVEPSAKKKSKVVKKWIYDENGKKIPQNFYFGNVDYNAQRLARTLISHAYQQAFQVTNQYDPFVIGYKWLTSNFHGRVCEICRDRAETDKFELGIGVFPKDKMPLDHPNGMCTFEAVFNMSAEQIGKKIDQWYLSPVGTFPDIDKFAESFLRKI